MCRAVACLGVEPSHCAESEMSFAIALEGRIGRGAAYDEVSLLGSESGSVLKIDRIPKGLGDDDLAQIVEVQGRSVVQIGGYQRQEGLAWL